MNEMTLEKTPGLVGDRSGPAGAGARREATSPGVGQAGNPEVTAVAKRRKHSAEYKLRILAEVERNPGQTGMILRREGLYSSSLSNWRQWRDKMRTPKKPTSENKRLHNELTKAKRENARLTLKLQKAQGLIELQKKTSEILELMSRNANEGNS